MKKARPARYHKYFLLFTIFVPVLFFLALESALRVFGYGVNIEQWIATDGKLLLNPELGRRYFHTIQNVPISNQDTFDRQKGQNAFRVFVLGESSAAGYPYTPNGAFSRWLKKQLEILYPECKIEVVNLGMTAVSSYMLRDIFPGVLEQKPDLVLIYTGHNEYYGALGVGSAESIGVNPTIVRLTLYLGKFKTFELFRNSIQALSDMFSGQRADRKDGTLMSRMAKDQYIKSGSREYLAGLSQFESNIRDILEMSKKKGVPVVLATLVSNLKDQVPFISLNDDVLPTAQRIFQTARSELATRNLQTADSLFRLAKDLDVLRFRAPEQMNHLIMQLGTNFRYPVLHLDSIFNAASPDGIVGNNLMTDHLHPTLEGYRLMARSFLELMRRNNLLPHCNEIRLSDRELDSMTVARFPFSRLDSVIAVYRIKILKNDWPYIEKAERKKFSELLRPNDFVEQTAFEFLSDRLTWESAHKKVAGWHLANKNYTDFRRQMDVVITQYPLIVEYYDFVANELIKAEKYDDAHPYLAERYQTRPDAYSTKWLGTIHLWKGEVSEAIRYLEESLNHNSSDPQVWYNISGAYSHKKEFRKALDAINRCLKIDPSYPRATGLKNQLDAVVRQ